MDQLPYDDPATLKQVMKQIVSHISAEHQIAEKTFTQMMDTDCQRFAFTLIDQIIIPGDPTDGKSNTQIFMHSLTFLKTPRSDILLFYF